MKFRITVERSRSPQFMHRASAEVRVSLDGFETAYNEPVELGGTFGLGRRGNIIIENSNRFEDIVARMKHEILVNLAEKSPHSLEID